MMFNLRLRFTCRGAAMVATAVAVGGVVAACSAGTAGKLPGSSSSSPAAGGATSSAPTSAPAATSAASAQSISAGQSLIVPTRGRAADWDVDGDGRPDRARLVYFGGSGPNNWELVVDMTKLGQQAVRFTGSPVLPGNTGAPTVAGSVDADRDGHAEIFVKADSGASTQFWTIFTLAAGRIQQVTSQGKPVRLTVGGSVTHQSGLRCDGAQLVTVGESAVAPQDTTWIYQRDTFAWSGAELVPGSTLTGQVTSAQPGNAPTAYTGVGCGDLPQSAPPYTPSNA